MAGTTAWSTTIAKGVQLIADPTAINYSAGGDIIDLSSHDSTDMFREKCAGMRDGGSVTIEFNLDLSDAGQVALWTDYCDGSLDAYTITYTLGTGAPTLGFNAIVNSFDINGPYDDKLSGSAELVISGKPILTP
jgi:predicted secreted protein